MHWLNKSAVGIAEDLVSEYMLETPVIWYFNIFYTVL